jgi:hypothetical protein
VLDLPADRRIAGIVASVNRVHGAVSALPAARSGVAAELQEEIEAFAAAPATAAAR